MLLQILKMWWSAVMQTNTIHCMFLLFQSSTHATERIVAIALIQFAFLYMAEYLELLPSSQPGNKILEIIRCCYLCIEVSVTMLFKLYTFCKNYCIVSNAGNFLENTSR